MKKVLLLVMMGSLFPDTIDYNVSFLIKNVMFSVFAWIYNSVQTKTIS